MEVVAVEVEEEEVEGIHKREVLTNDNAMEGLTAVSTA